MEIEFTKVFVSYIRRYVLTAWYVESITPDKTRFSSPIFGDMFLLLNLINQSFPLSSFSSPIFGDMFLLVEHGSFKTKLLLFSSPIFGDMFLLKDVSQIVPRYIVVFVSYIRRYVLTQVFWMNSKNQVRVFVSYIRRYVLTRRNKKWK